MREETSFWVDDVGAPLSCGDHSDSASTATDEEESGQGEHNLRNVGEWRGDDV